MAAVTTRRARAEDADRLAEIAVAAYSPYLERMGGLRPAPLDADYAASIARDVVRVTETEGRVVGYLVLVDQPECTLLENVAVHPDWQGRGIGRLLLAMAEEHARAIGTSTVRLYTHATMHENRRLYSRLGYLEMDRRVVDELDRHAAVVRRTGGCAPGARPALHGRDLGGLDSLDLARQARTLGEDAACSARRDIQIPWRWCGIICWANLTSASSYIVVVPWLVASLPLTIMSVEPHPASSVTPVTTAMTNG